MSGPVAPTAGCYNRVVARGTMKDQYGRELSDLRISLTDRCNLRCVYCMPAEGIDFRPAEELLADHELLLLVRVAAELGVSRVRLTGGSRPSAQASSLWCVRSRRSRGSRAWR